VFEAGEPVGRKWISPQTAYIMADILAGNTNPSINNFWGTRFQLHNGPGNSYRVAAVKTGTTNEVEDLSTYGFLPAPGGKAPAIALGVWMGNSNHRPATIDSSIDLFAIDGPGKIWRAFMNDFMNGEPAPDFKRPSRGLVATTIDAFSGGAPGPWTKQTTQEYFLSGTQPGSRGAIDKPGLLYSQRCGGWMVDPAKAEPERDWRPYVRDWARRAQRGQGVASGTFGTITLHLENRDSFGGQVTDGGPCPTPKPEPTPIVESPQPGQPAPEPTRRPRATPEPTPRPTCRPNGRPPGCKPVPAQGHGNGRGNGDGDNQGEASAADSTTASATPTAETAQRAGFPIDLATVVGLFSFPQALVPSAPTSPAIRLGRRRRRRS
jgi:membrane peptidoglycan carboxypeptidase